MSDDYLSRKRVAVPNAVANAAAPTRVEASYVPASVDLSGATRIRMDVKADAGGVASVSRLLSAAGTTNATVVKASAGRVYKITGYNDAATLLYLKLYNSATAPDVGTDTPVATIAMKANDAFDISLGDLGMYFSAGISFAMTTGVADDDTTALTAADIVGMNIWYA